MKLRIAWLTILCVALSAIPAGAQQFSYNNGPINGTTNAWQINFGYMVSGTFYLGDSRYPNGLSFNAGVWEFPGDVMSSLNWAISNAPLGGPNAIPRVKVYGSGVASGYLLTDQFISFNQYGYQVDLITATIDIPQIHLGVGTFWLNLSNAAVPGGDPCIGMRTVAKAARRLTVPPTHMGVRWERFLRKLSPFTSLVALTGEVQVVAARRSRAGPLNPTVSSCLVLASSGWLAHCDESYCKPLWKPNRPTT